MQSENNIKNSSGGDHRFLTTIRGDEFPFRLEVPARRSRGEAWQMLEGKITAGKVIPIKKRRHPVRALRVVMTAAATLTLLVSFSFYLFHTRTQVFSTVRGESLSLFLPDSSEVILNGSSTVRFNTLSWHMRRKLSLEGEAFFRVRKGKTFTVTAGRGEVTVLGTRFTVLSRSENFRVLCYSGKVRVSLTDKTSLPVILTRGSCVETGRAGTLNKARSFDPDRSPLWQEQKHYFNNTPLEKVLQVFAQHYNVTLKYNPAITQNRYYTGFFPENNMENALNLICIPMNLQCRPSGEKKIEILENNK